MNIVVPIISFFVGVVGGALAMSLLAASKLSSLLEENDRLRCGLDE